MQGKSEVLWLGIKQASAGTWHQAYEHDTAAANRMKLEQGGCITGSRGRGWGGEELPFVKHTRVHGPLNRLGRSFRKSFSVRAK